MGSHAGCVGGGCKTKTHLELLSLIGFPKAQKMLPLAITFDPNFAVGVNQIELASHGSQDYRFLPDVKHAEHTFINITASTNRMPFYEAEVRLNPDAGKSFTSFRAVDPNQEGFFPAIWQLHLYLQFALHIPFLGVFGRKRITLFNKEPLMYKTAEPLTGFPPLNGPPFLLLHPVSLLEKSTLYRIMTITKSAQIAPINRILYDIQIGDQKFVANGNFTIEATIRLIQQTRSVPTAIALMPTRGVKLETPDFQRVKIGPKGFRFTVKGSITNPAEEHLGVAIRPYSLDPKIMGFGREDIDFPTQAPAHPLAIDIPPVRRVRSEETIKLSVGAKFAPSVRRPTLIWVAPQGIALENTDSLSPSFVAPKVKELTDIWFTLYVKDKDMLSRPYKIEMQIEP